MAESESAWIPFAAEGVGTSHILHGAAHATAVRTTPTWCARARNLAIRKQGWDPEQRSLSGFVLGLSRTRITGTTHHF